MADNLSLPPTLANLLAWADSQRPTTTAVLTHGPLGIGCQILSNDGKTVFQTHVTAIWLLEAIKHKLLSDNLNPAAPQEPMPDAPSHPTPVSH